MVLCASSDDPKKVETPLPDNAVENYEDGQADDVLTKIKILSAIMHFGKLVTNFILNALNNKTVLLEIVSRFTIAIFNSKQSLPIKLSKFRKNLNGNYGHMTPRSPD